MNILITRPSPDGEALVAKLLSVGKFAYHLPLIYFSSGKSLFSLVKQLNSLSKGDFLFIVSQRAIKYAHIQLLRTGMHWPTTITYYSIGHKTSLKMYRLSGILSKYPKHEETSESLLRLPELRYNVSGRRILILQGNNGRSILKNTLKRRGALVLCCECYARRKFKYDGIEQYHRMLMLNIKIIVITSGEILKQLYYLIPENYRMKWLIRCRLIVVSSRLAVLAQNLGWNDIIIIKSANNSVILTALMRLI